MGEYFETSRRTCMRVWPDETVPGEGYRFREDHEIVSPARASYRALIR